MRLNWLKLENIRSYRSVKIDFPEGSLLLSGDIGAGKTTILMAIEMALFGIRGSSLTYASLLRNGTNEGSIELCFTLGKRSIIIKRILKRGKDSIKQDAGYVLVDDLKKEGTPEELRAWLLHELGYPIEAKDKSLSLVYRYSVYTPQEMMKQILMESSDLRLDTLRKILQIDKYKRIMDNTSSYAKSLRDNIRILQGKVSDLDEKKERLGTIVQDLSLKKMEAGKAQAGIKKIEVELSSQVTKVKQAKEQQDTFRSQLVQRNLLIQKDRLLAEQLETITRKLEQGTIQLGTMREKHTLLAKVDESVRSSDDIGNDIKLIEERLQKQETETQLLRERLKTLADQARMYEQEIRLIPKLEKDIAERQETLKALEGQKEMIVELEANGKDMKERLAAINASLGKERGAEEQSKDLMKRMKDLTQCPECLQEVDASHKEHIITTHQHLLETRKATLEMLREEQSRSEMESRKIEMALAKAREDHGKIRLIESEIRNSKSQLDRSLGAQGSYSKLKVDQDEDQAKMSALQTKGSSTDREKLSKLKIDMRAALDIEKRRGERKQLGSFIKDKLEEVGQLEDQQSKGKTEQVSMRTAIDGSSDLVGKAREHEMALRKEEQTLKGIEGGLNEQNVLAAGLVSSLKELGIQMTDLEREVREKEKDRKIIIEQGKLNDWLQDFFGNLVSTIEKHVLLSIHSEFTELFTEWFSLLVDDPSINVRLDDTFSPIIEQNGYETDFEHLSGGEKTALSLAYRLSLNKVINDFISQIQTKDLIILDEPTDGFSSAQLDKIRDVLDQLPNRQIIIVSHEPKIETFVDKVIRIEKQDHLSTISS